MDRVCELYAEKIVPLISELEREKTVQYYAQIDWAAHMNSLRFGTGVDAYEAEKTAISTFFAQRKKFLDSVWIARDTYYTLLVSTEGWAIRNAYYHIKEGECPPNFGYAEDAFEGWFYLGTDIPYDSSKPMTEDIAIYAKLKE